MIASLRTLQAATAEFFTLRRAEQRARGYGRDQAARVRAHFEAAGRRLRAGRRALDPVVAAALLLDAVRGYLRAAAAAEGRVEGAMAELPRLPDDDAQVRSALASDDPLFLDSLSAVDAARTRWALDRAAAVARGQVEARSVTHIRGARWGRAGAVALLAAYVLWLVVRAAVFLPNVALDKPVHPSSREHGDGKELVDGTIGTSFGLKTNTEDSPSVVVDLLAPYRIDRLEIYNRVDGWFGDSLPLVVELSRDGTTYEEIGRRDTYWGTTWIVPGGARIARYVRVRVTRRSYLALSEIEVFGKKAQPEPPRSVPRP